jgi:hypothetical protein
VLSHIVVLGNTVKKLDTWRGPVIEDSKHAKNLWAESLNMNEINEADLDKGVSRACVSRVCCCRW